MDTDGIKRDIYKLVREKGVFFGSRALKVHDSSSDFDYFIRAEDIYSSDIYDHIHTPGVFVGVENEYSYEEGVVLDLKMLYKGRSINIVGISSNDHFQAREKAIMIMRQLNERLKKDGGGSPFKRKRTRIEFFRATVNCYLETSQPLQVSREDKEYHDDKITNYDPEDVPF